MSVQAVLRKIVPYIYQKRAIKAGYDALIGPLQRALIVMATGLGKTLTSALIAKRFRPRRMLFLVHNNFILNHAMDEYRLVFGDSKTMVPYNGLTKEGAHEADIVFATWQTMGRHRKKWKRDHFDLVVVDESHHTAADSFKPTLKYFKAAKLGITATPDRTDGEDIRKIFGRAVIDISLEEAIANGWLPRIEYHVIADESLDEATLQQIAAEIGAGQRFTLKEVNRRLFIRKREEEVSKHINGYKEKAIVFCSSIDHAERMVKSLENAATFHSRKSKIAKITWKKNTATLAKLKSGAITKVCAVNAFNEGVDVPSVGLIAFCRVTEALSVFRQQLGRGLRPGKDKLIVLDFVGNLQRMQIVLDMMNRISEMDRKKYAKRARRKQEVAGRSRYEVSGKGFEFIFSDTIVDLLKVMEHCNQSYYPTWQEASEAARRLGVTKEQEYKRLHKNDPRLPPVPSYSYPDWPNWFVFLKKEGVYRARSTIYKNWKQAARATQRLGLKSRAEYKANYQQDPRLPSSPHIVYPDFPNWYAYFGKKGEKRYKEDMYPTLEQASEAVKKLGITGQVEYKKLYKRDPRLPSNPRRVYPDWPGWIGFLGKTYYRLPQKSKKNKSDDPMTRDNVFKPSLKKTLV